MSVSQLTKDEVRDFAKEQRALIPDAEKETLARNLAYTLIDMPEFVSASSILAYAPVRDEISPAFALELRQRIIGEAITPIAYPRVTGAHEMEARIDRADALKSGAFGIPEPDAQALFVDPEQIDLVLVPGLGFDRSGFRVGYGKGYYDSYIARLNPHAITIGLTYEQTLLSSIPIEEHDRFVDFVATPRAIIRCDPAGVK
ncbi:MAG: 5-formyltetrahydrofolate cyclo-ligase [Actinomycetia bacterium]|nr:5-formyltetrahydrofolate cyclo-ligase [Actinomycetes bacterium]